MTPTLSKQCCSFMVGSALFAVAAAMGVWGVGSAKLSNGLCFVGAWFFTAAGLLQLKLSGSPTLQNGHSSVLRLRAEWLAAAIQSAGTVMFNVSTSAALFASTVAEEKHLVWNPDAGGSVLFLISAICVYVAYVRARHTLWEPQRSGWWACHINLLGCIAFALSAVGAYVLQGGALEDAALANWGTLWGALCFFLASFIALPQLKWNQQKMT